MSVFDLEHIFTYHAPTEEQTHKYGYIRDLALQLAEAIVSEVPSGADQSAAVRLVREAVMTANAGIALGGRVHKIDH